MKMKRKLVIASIAVIILLIIVQIALADNDPGHDTLYIEEQGDSELNGSLNITSNLTLQSTSKLKQGGVLTLYADGSTPGTGSYISATGNPDYNLYIDTQGSIYFKSLTTGMIYIGVTGSTPTSLNVSGALYLNGSNNKLDTGPAATASSLDLYWGDKLICDASEANCGWVSSTTGGGNISGAGTSGTLAKFTGDGTIGNSIISESGNTLTIAGNISMPTSFYIGSGAAAIGQDAIAIGTSASASNNNAMAIGRYTDATTDSSLAVGNAAQATGGGATAVGGVSSAAGYAAIALGLNSNASANYAVAIGYGVVNDVVNSTRFGGAIYANGNVNLTTYNVSAVNCIVFDTGGKICSGA